VPENVDVVLLEPQEEPPSPQKSSQSQSLFPITTLASGCEIWLRDVGTAKSGLVLERCQWWVDHRVVVSGDEHEHEHAWKGSGKGKA
jgi:hypothetical protein